MPGSVVGIPVVRMLLPASASNRPGRALPTAGELYVVVHETGNTNAGADATSQIRYLQSAEARSRSVSYHLSVDDHQIVQGLPLDEIGWHAGDGCDDPAVDVGCFRSVAIETCVNRDGDKTRTRRNLAELIARICAGDPAFDWGGGSTRGRFDIDHLMQHNWVADDGKNCPMQIRNEGFWPTLMTWVDEAWKVWKPGAPPPPPPPPIWPSAPIPAPDELRAQGYRLTALTERRIKATQGGTFRTAPHRDAPAIAKPPYKAGRPYTFAFRATVNGEDWYVSSRGSWAPAKNFEGGTT